MIVNHDGKDFDKLIRSVMRMNCFVTFWPLEKGHGSVKSTLRIVHRIILFLIIAATAIAITLDIFYNDNNMNEIVECGLISAAFYLSFWRLIVFSTHQKEMTLIIDTMRADWYNASSEERDILLEKCKLSYKTSNFFIFTVALAMLSFVVHPCVEVYFLDGDREKLPFRGYYLVNHTESPTFECIFFTNVATGVFGCGTIAAGTSFTVVSIIHSSAKFAVLQEKLKSLKNGKPNINEDIAECVVAHQESIKFAEILEKVISPLALGQFIASSGLLCFAGFQIASNQADKEMMLKYCTFLQSAILELFLFSYSGHQLLDESEAIGESAYFCDWVGGSFEKNLQLIIMRARSPCKITAAKFYDLSLQSFSKVLSTSFSYFTVLQAVNN